MKETLPQSPYFFRPGKALIELLIVIGIVLIANSGFATVSIPLDDPNIAYDGVLYPIVTSTSVTFNRHTPAAYADASSGIYYTPCDKTRATQTGIRIRFKTSSPHIYMTFAPQTSPAGYFYGTSDGSYNASINPDPQNGFSVLINGVVQSTVYSKLSFTINNPTPGTSSTFEVTLPDLYSVVLTGLSLDGSYSLEDPGTNILPKYAAFGTSITHGTGQFCNTAKTYAFKVAEALGWDLYNFAVAGSTVGYQLAYDIKGQPMDVITVEQGFNDWASIYTTSLSAVVNTYAAFIDSLRKFQPTATIYCIAPITTTYTPQSPAPRYNLDDFRAEVLNIVNTRKTAGDTKIFYIDGKSMTDASMLFDGIHLNEYGANAFADSIIKFIDPSKLPATSDTPTDYSFESSSWSTFTDNIGSKVDSFDNSHPVRAYFDQVPNQVNASGTTWGYSILAATTDPWTGVEYVKISYMSDYSLIMEMPQPTLQNGEEYQTQLSASPGVFKTVLLPISAFAQPAWASTKDIMNRHAINTVYFSPILDPNAGGKANIQIDTLILYKSNPNAQSQDNTVSLIPADNSLIQYSGRIDFTDPKNPTFSYPGVSIKAKFQGSRIDVLFKDYGLGGNSGTNYFDVFIDGVLDTVLQVTSMQATYTIASNLSDADHTIELFKRTETSVGKTTFQGFNLLNGKTLLTPPAKPSGKIEFIGDSYTVGYGDEVSTDSPNTGFHSVNENNYKAWGAIVARSLNDEYICTSYSGKGLYRNNDLSTGNTVPKMYDEIIAGSISPAWDHTRFMPDIIVIHLGTNDFYQVVNGHPVDSATFVNTYISFVAKLRGYYPNACIIATVPNGLSDYYPANANNRTHAKNFIKAVVDHFISSGDNKVYNYVQVQQGLDPSEHYGEDWHPSAATQQHMADDLLSFINSNVSGCGVPLAIINPTVALPNSSINVAPNPIADNANVTLNLSEPCNGSLVLCDINGKTLKVLMEGSFGKDTNINMSMNEYPSGIYILKLATDKGILVKKVCK